MALCLVTAINFYHSLWLFVDSPRTARATSVLLFCTILRRYTARSIFFLYFTYLAHRSGCGCGLPKKVISSGHGQQNNSHKDYSRRSHIKLYTRTRQNNFSVSSSSSSSQHKIRKPRNNTHYPSIFFIKIACVQAV